MAAGKRPAPAAADLRALILAFTLGVLLVHAVPRLLPIAALLPLLVLALPRSRGRALWLCAALGMAATLWQAERRLADRWPPERHGELRAVQGVIASLPERSAARAAGNATLRFRFEPTDAALPEALRVSWYRTDAVPKAGECWQLQLKLRTPRGSMNPGGFDYEGWLFRQGIGGTATVRGGERCAVQPRRPLLTLRQHFADRVSAWLPGHPALPFILALTVGEQSAIPDEQWEVFRRTGTTHLVAVSGFNVGIVAALAYVLGRALWSLWPPLLLRLPAPRAGWCLAGVAAVAYAGLAGFQAPVLRATLMLLVVIAAGFAGRLSQPSRVLALAWGVIVASDPLGITDPGLWLSFAAVAAIFYVVRARLARPRWLVGAVHVQLMLSLALLPLTLYFFQGLSWPAPLVNLLAVPLFALVTPVLLIALGLAATLPALGLPALRGVAGLLLLIQEGLQQAADWPYAWVGWSAPPFALALLLLGALLLFAPRGLPLRPLALLCCVPVFLPPRPAPVEGFSLAALDVGQGLAVVVRTANHVLVYDAGPSFHEGFDAGASVVVPYLLHQGIRKVDRLLLSHGDNDHAGGVKALRQRLPVRTAYGPADAPPCVEGLHWQWDGVAFETLHPSPERPDSGNNGSCVLRIRWGQQQALLTGDIERSAERRLLEAHADKLASGILVAPHHGSRSSSTPGFVAAVSPRLVIFPAAWRSHYGHPHPQVLQRYADLGAQSEVTGVVGATELSWQDDRWQLRRWRQHAARFWNAPPLP